MASVALRDRSMRPSPSKSTAQRTQLLGMNCGMPMAPA